MALALIPLGLVGACDTGDPTAPGTPDYRTPEIGIFREGPSAERLAGAWAREEKFDLDGAVARRVTIWRFDAVGTCRLTIEFYPAPGFEPEIDETVCAYEASGGTLTLRFPGVSGDERLLWELEGRDVLVLDGVRYVRIGGG